MNLLRRVGSLGVIALILISCSEKTGTTINVKIDGELPENGQMVLFQFTEEGFNPIDTFEMISSGEFEVAREITKTGFFRVDVARQNFMNVVLEGSESDVDIDLSTDVKTVTGSPSAQIVNEIDLRAAELQLKSNEINQSGMIAMQQGDTETVVELRQEFLDMQKEFQADIKNMISSSSSSLAALYGLNYLGMDEEYDFFDTVVAKSEGVLGKEHFWVAELRTNLDAIKQLAVGQPAPDFELPTPSGEMIALSDLRGSYVLIDFWAAWCRPCRQENPNVVRVYNKYSDGNFEILGVSLDRTKEAWVEAIEADGLPWLHVSDLKYYDSKATQLYNINFIPATYLIGPDGTIVDKNLRGQSLEDKLEELFGAS